LYAEPNFNLPLHLNEKPASTACVVLSVGKYQGAANLGALGGDNAASIRVGANVQASLFTQDDLTGRGTTFTTDNANLADDPVGNKSLSSVWVQGRSAIPSAPRPAWPVNNASYNNARSFTLAWENAGAATSFQVSLVSPTEGTRTSSWLSVPYWAVGSLGQGAYTWQVRGSGPGGIGPWSTVQSFTITSSGPSTPPQVTAPYTATMENLAPDWVTSGEWDLTDEYNHTPTPGAYVSYKYDVQGGKNYDTGAPNGGHLTSPPVYLPTGEVFYLRFWHRYETEGPGLHWDQRWVQISVDDGPFTNTLQLHSDVPNNWRSSPPLSLAPYAGHVIRVRFEFETLDRLSNIFKGWGIDDFSITSDPPPACSEDISNDTPPQASLITLGSLVGAQICPNGDLDYYRFTGSAGQHIGAALHTLPAAGLDTVLQLLDSDGQTVLVENDDRQAGVQTDSWLTAVLPRTGNYFLRVQAWDHPNIGGSEAAYQLRLVADSQAPTANWVNPPDSSFLYPGEIELELEADDSGAGVSHVVFYYHPPDWQNGQWSEIGQDWDPTSGWNWVYPTTSLSPGESHAFYARIYDWAGNWTAVGAWRLSNRRLVFLPLAVK
jgi:hypothetical protein